MNRTMKWILNVILISNVILFCKGVSYLEQLEHVAKRRRENRGIDDVEFSRRFNTNPGQTSVILGSPSMASHLPEAESILPGHTLLRPAMGMLKSAIKFPHKDLDNGAGVYGNIDTFGIRYDGRNDRVMYSGFRRMPERYIVVVPKSSRSGLRKSAKKPPYAYLDLENVMDNTNALRAGSGSETNRPKSQQLAYIDEDDSTSDGVEPAMSEESNQIQEIVKAPGEGGEEKMAWFWKSKDAYNHIKISPDAPDHSELLPSKPTSELGDWWFFNQGDFQPFEENI